MISVFCDRIEILSCGSIPAGQTLEGFFAGESVPVNQKLSEIFLQLHISEKTGRGVPIVVEKYGKSAYEFRENADESRFRGSQAKMLPLKILSSSQTGRQYLVAHVLRRKEFKTFRLDNMLEVKIGNVCNEYDTVKEKFMASQKYLWGASFGNFKELQTVEFTVKFRENEEHIYQRLVRKKRCGKVERLLPTQACYSATVWDVNEMIPWIRTFIMRITDFHISDKEIEERFWADLYKMRDLYAF